MVVEVKARGRRHSRDYIEEAPQGAPQGQRRDRPPGPLRSHRIKAEGALGFSYNPVEVNVDPGG